MGFIGSLMGATLRIGDRWEGSVRERSGQIDRQGNRRNAEWPAKGLSTAAERPLLDYWNLLSARHQGAGGAYQERLASISVQFRDIMTEVLIGYHIMKFTIGFDLHLFLLRLIRVAPELE
jgi:hypothetical protein